jgi:hypothetical protein
MTVLGTSSALGSARSRSLLDKADALVFTNQLCAVLPLPFIRGEGRGEGSERRWIMPLARDSGICRFPPMARPIRNEQKPTGK